MIISIPFAPFTPFITCVFHLSLSDRVSLAPKFPSANFNLDASRQNDNFNPADHIKTEICRNGVDGLEFQHSQYRGNIAFSR